MSTPYQIHLITKFKVSANQIYSAWLSSETHGAFTGGESLIEAKVGGKHSAWDNYITGEILALEVNSRIYMSWRTTDFPEDAPDSFLEILLEPNKTGCSLTINQWGLPSDQVTQYTNGWLEYYFEPMHSFFNA